MSNSPTVFAKLAGIQRSIKTLLDETSIGAYKSRPKSNFNPNEVKKYFDLAGSQLAELKQASPNLYGDFSDLDMEPNVKMADGADYPYYFGRNQLQALLRDIEQIFALRDSSENTAQNQEKLNIKYPSKVTILWLLQHLSVWQWVGAFAFVISVFVLGVTVGNSEFYQKRFKVWAKEINTPAVDTAHNKIIQPTPTAPAD